MVLATSAAHSLSVPSTSTVNERVLLLLATYGELDGAQIKKSLGKPPGPAPQTLEARGHVRRVGQRRRNGTLAVVWQITAAGRCAIAPIRAEAARVRAQRWAAAAAAVSGTSRDPAALMPGACRTPAFPAIEDLGWHDAVALLYRCAGLPIHGIIGRDQECGHDDIERADDSRMHFGGPLRVVVADDYSYVWLDMGRDSVSIQRDNVTRARITRPHAQWVDGDLTITTAHTTIWISQSDAPVGDLVRHYGRGGAMTDAMAEVLQQQLADHNPFFLSRHELLHSPLITWAAPAPRNMVTRMGPFPMPRSGRLPKPLHQVTPILVPARAEDLAHQQFKASIGQGVAAMQARHRQRAR